MKLSDQLRTGQCLENTGCGTMPVCACTRMDEAADLLDECERAFVSLAALDDHGANDRLSSTGSYGSFDEPGAVQVSRSMLAKLRAAQKEQADE